MSKENILSLVTQAKQTLEVLDESKGNNSTFIKNRVLGILKLTLKELEEEQYEIFIKNNSFVRFAHFVVLLWVYNFYSSLDFLCDIHRFYTYITWQSYVQDI